MSAKRSLSTLDSNHHPNIASLAMTTNQEIAKRFREHADRESFEIQRDMELLRGSNDITTKILVKSALHHAVLQKEVLEDFATSLEEDQLGIGFRPSIPLLLELSDRAEKVVQEFGYLNNMADLPFVRNIMKFVLKDAELRLQFLRDLISEFKTRL